MAGRRVENSVSNDAQGCDPYIHWEWGGWPFFILMTEQVAVRVHSGYKTGDWVC